MEYFNGTRDILWAIIFGLLICLALFITMMLQHPQIFSMVRYGMQIRLALNGIIYKKVILKAIYIVSYFICELLFVKLLKVGICQKKSNVEVLNLLSTDAANIENFVIITFYFPKQLV